MKTLYQVNGESIEVEVDEKEDFEVGENICLAKEFHDISLKQDWAKQGYCLMNSKPFFDHSAIYHAIEKLVIQILAEEDPTLCLDGFTLEKYHQFVDDEMHQKVFARTRRLYPPDFEIDIEQFVDRLGVELGRNLCVDNAIAKSKQWIIVRINRPVSEDFNTVHKDVYESYDGLSAVPEMINIGVPVCGVNEKSGLPVAPGSHLLTEDKVLRTRQGGFMNGRQYTVNSILSWDGSHCLQSLSPNEERLIVFSSFLVHGLALNRNPDTTRISLEFRLFADKSNTNPA